MPSVVQGGLSQKEPSPCIFENKFVISHTWHGVENTKYKAFIKREIIQD
jgi:hypothetical protein